MVFKNQNFNPEMYEFDIAEPHLQFFLLYKCVPFMLPLVAIIKTIRSKG